MKRDTKTKAKPLRDGTSIHEDETADTPPVAERPTKRRRMKTLAMSCVIALVLGGGATGLSLYYADYCEKITPKITDVPKALQIKGTDMYGSTYSVPAAVDLGEIVYPLYATYDNVDAALTTLGEKNKAAVYVGQLHALPPITRQNIDTYYGYAMDIANSGDKPDWWDDEMLDFKTVKSTYDSTNANQRKLEYMQCKPAEKLVHDSTFRDSLTR